VDLESLRLSVHLGFVRHGRAPSPAELAAEHGADETAVGAGLRQLAAPRHVVLAEGGAIVLAHPFAAIPLGFAVMGERTLWWGGCAWDAFALPHLLPEESAVLVATRCPGCGRALAWNAEDGSPPVDGEVAHFLVPVAGMWDDVVASCSNQRLLCASCCVDGRLEATGQGRGYVRDLATLWRLASHWYDGRLERGYQQRDPVASAAYFHDVGLSGAFWGL
jgi:hypothetical protein